MTTDAASTGQTLAPPHILVVDDSRDAHTMLRARLGHAGFALTMATSGYEALELIEGHGLPDLVILDIMMPGMDGFAVADAIRTLGAVPIICLSALADTDTKVDAINRFAEDYVTKPFAFPELMARIQRVLRRTAQSAGTARTIRVDRHLSVDFARQVAQVDGVLVSLTPIESRILRTLYQAHGEIVTPEALLERCWDSLRTGSVASLWVHVRRLRTKIEIDVQHPQYILTARGKGYYMPVSDQGTAARVM